jgi:hypothetical protein
MLHKQKRTNKVSITGNVPSAVIARDTLNPHVHTIRTLEGDADDKPEDRTTEEVEAEGVETTTITSDSLPSVSLAAPLRSSTASLFLFILGLFDNNTSPSLPSLSSSVGLALRFPCTGTDETPPVETPDSIDSACWKSRGGMPMREDDSVGDGDWRLDETFRLLCDGERDGKRLEDTEDDLECDI